MEDSVVSLKLNHNLVVFIHNHHMEPFHHNNRLVVYHNNRMDNTVAFLNKLLFLKQVVILQWVVGN
jgi:hypothetical protein